MITLEESQAIRREWHEAESEKTEVFDVMFGEFANLLDTADIAPELLAACKAMKYILKQDTEWAKELRSQPWYARMEEALSKAEPN